MRRFLPLFIILGVLVLTVVFVLPVVRRTLLKETKVWRIGILVRGAGYEPAVIGFKRKMTALGYREGETVIYDTRFVSAREELAKTAREFVAEKVDLIHAYSTPATQAAYEETKNLPKPIPVVFGSMGDPLISGVIKDIQQPGTNVTGVASLSTELTAKRLALLQEIRPDIKRIAMPHTIESAGDLAANKSVEIAKETARELDLDLILYPVRSLEDNAVVARRVRQETADGMIIGGDSLIWGSIEVYIAQAIKEKIPFAAFDLTQVEKGALVGFGPNYEISGEQSAVLAHQILRGKNPSNIAIQAPQKLLLAVNLDTAQAIGITLSQAFLKQADVVIGGK